MSDLQEYIQQCMQEGRPFEARSLRFFSRWYQCRLATPEEDMKGKFDLLLSRHGVEEKVQVKMPSRTGNVFIEYQSVNGQPGWGQTCDLLAKWLNDDTVMIVRMSKLREAWGDPTTFRECYAREADGQWFRRPTRQDILREFTVDWLKVNADARIFHP